MFVCACNILRHCSIVLVMASLFAFDYFSSSFSAIHVSPRHATISLGFISHSGGSKCILRLAICHIWLHWIHTRIYINIYISIHLLWLQIVTAAEQFFQPKDAHNKIQLKLKSWNCINAGICKTVNIMNESFIFSYTYSYFICCVPQCLLCYYARHCVFSRFVSIAFDVGEANEWAQNLSGKVDFRLWREIVASIFLIL